MHSEPLLRTEAFLARPGTRAAQAASVTERSSLDHFLDPVMHLLDESQVTEVCINQPGEAFIERYSGWTCQPMPFATFDWCMQLARLVANHTKQRISAQEPLLSATLPTGARIQIVVPPATEEGREFIVVAVANEETIANLDRYRDITRRLAAHASRRGDFAAVHVCPDGSSDVPDLDTAGVQVDELGLHRPTLDDVFLTLTGHAAEPGATEDEELRDEKEIA